MPGQQDKEMQEQAVKVKVLKPFEKYVLKRPPFAIEMTSVGDTVYASFDNVHIPLTPRQVQELHGYCGRAMEIMMELSKRKSGEKK